MNQNAQQHVAQKLLEHEVEKLSQKRKMEEPVAEKVEKQFLVTSMIAQQVSNQDRHIILRNQ